MTPDKPSPAALLETAAEVLRREFLPNAGDKKLDMLMILSILGVAGRALEDGQGLENRQAARYSNLDEKTAEALAEAIRAGRYDSDNNNAALLHQMLSEDARDRLALANPAYLAVAEKEEGAAG